MVKKRHAKVSETISSLSTKPSNTNVYPPSATPVAPGVGAKYMTKVMTICSTIIDTGDAAGFNPLINMTENENKDNRNKRVKTIDKDTYFISP